MRNIGIYVHTPFCKQKCPYCDFYSLAGSDTSLRGSYTDTLLKAITLLGKRYPAKADTLYFGGGTPTLLKSENISKIIDSCRSAFNLSDAEITLEANPETVTQDELFALKVAGINRLSMGLQSAVDSELSALGRRHSSLDAKHAVELARAAGISNISLDLMLGIPGQTIESAEKSVEFCLSLGIPHISAYMLKIEKGTPFYSTVNSLDLPDDDLTADIYEKVSDLLRAHGFLRYEISTFALPGFESRHNLKYWNCEEYLGIGPSAHSFIDGKRMFFPRSINEFLSNERFDMQYDCEGGSIEEFIMLRLRLKDGFSLSSLSQMYPNYDLSQIISTAKKLSGFGFVLFDGDRISLSDRGVLISNSIITEFFA